MSRFNYVYVFQDKLLAKIEDKDTDTTRKAVLVQNISTDSEEEVRS